MKGIAPVFIGLGVAVSLLIFEGIYFNIFVGTSITKVEMAKELEFIQAVNKVEMVKRGLPYALYYSFNEAMKRNDYTSVKDITDTSNFEKNISSVFNEYTAASKEVTGIDVPAGSVAIVISGNRADLSFTPKEFMKYSSDWFKIFDSSNVTIKISGSSLVE
jgi:hypothetical protein